MPAEARNTPPHFAILYLAIRTTPGRNAFHDNPSVCVYCFVEALSVTRLDPNQELAVGKPLLTENRASALCKTDFMLVGLFGCERFPHKRRAAMVTPKDAFQLDPANSLGFAWRHDDHAYIS